MFEEIKKSIIQNLKVVRLYKNLEFQIFMDLFLDKSIRKAFLYGKEWKSFEDLMDEIFQELNTFKEGRKYSEKSSIIIILNKWLIIAYNEGKKKRYDE